ncbi:hypothetical protein BT69DRAFT_511314 [Atractiella rhizophila]|nr:hypothetical protein BT69DRAFT_511314 [Atractiella rhizophila]
MFKLPSFSTYFLSYSFLPPSNGLSCSCFGWRPRSFMKINSVQTVSEFHLSLIFMMCCPYPILHDFGHDFPAHCRSYTLPSS